MVLEHPLGETTWNMAAVILGGPALFLIGNLLFKAAVTGRRPVSHLAGLGVLALCAPASHVLPPVALSVATVATIVVEAIIEGRLAAPAWAGSRHSIDVIS